MILQIYIYIYIYIYLQYNYIYILYNIWYGNINDMVIITFNLRLKSLNKTNISFNKN